MGTDVRMLKAAAENAVNINRIDKRKSRFGAIGKRADGVYVYARNATSSCRNYSHHAEVRLCAKLTPASTIWLVRINFEGNWLLAKPCERCMMCMRHTGVKRVIYTIAHNEYGVIVL